VGWTAAITAQDAKDSRALTPSEGCVWGLRSHCSIGNCAVVSGCLRSTCASRASSRRFGSRTPTASHLIRPVDVTRHKELSEDQGGMIDWRLTMVWPPQLCFLRLHEESRGLTDSRGRFTACFSCVSSKGGRCGKLLMPAMMHTRVLHLDQKLCWCHAQSCGVLLARATSRSRERRLAGPSRRPTPMPTTRPPTFERQCRQPSLPVLAKFKPKTAISYGSCSMEYALSGEPTCSLCGLDDRHMVQSRYVLTGYSIDTRCGLLNTRDGARDGRMVNHRRQSDSGRDDECYIHGNIANTTTRQY
jgi:hypothetical protein